MPNESSSPGCHNVMQIYVYINVVKFRQAVCKKSCSRTLVCTRPRTRDGQTDGPTRGHPENTMPSAANEVIPSDEV